MPLPDEDAADLIVELTREIRELEKARREKETMKQETEAMKADLERKKRELERAKGEKGFKNGNWSGINIRRGSSRKMWRGRCSPCWRDRSS